ncbi:MAG: dicarboxylate/amino acid:cation symporter [Marinifilaceae bacterium]|jgi:Na+/H+-dicarboxylate symporter|nr:dicarboxylate/amino acid:cation symporter [Marinifilaceae bacterium]
MLKKLPLFTKILIGMFLGICLGILAVEYNFSKLIVDWVKPWGLIFLNLLKLVAVPLIFVSLVKGIAGLSDISRLSKLGLKTMSLYVLSTIIAISIGVVLVNIIKPGDAFPIEKKIEYKQKFEKAVSAKTDIAEKVAEESPLQFIVDIIPTNIFKSATDNSKMLQIIFFAILFGICMIAVPHEKVKTVVDFFNGLDTIILKMIDYIMYTAPYGVLALMAGLIVDFSGDLDLFTALGVYALTVILGLLSMILIIYPSFLSLVTKTGFKKFYKAISPAQLCAFSTSSSAATLPVTMDRVKNHLGVPDSVASFVLPVGVTINMDGTSCYQAIAAIFIAQVFGLELSFVDQVIIIITATVASIGTPGIPGGSIVMLIIVLSSVNIPSEGIALILGIDRPLDMLRTAVNVTGDAAISKIVAFTERK